MVEELRVSDARREYMAYHDHKERSAWATTAAFIGAAGGIYFQDNLISGLASFERALALVVILTIGFVLGDAEIFRKLLDCHHTDWS